MSFFFNADSNDGMCAWLYAASNAAKILEGEMCRMTLSKPKNGNAQHLRAVSIVPLRSGFKPAIESLKEFYGVKPATSWFFYPFIIGLTMPSVLL